MGPHGLGKGWDDATVAAGHRDRAAAERSWQDFVAGRDPAGVRAEVLGSWHRSAGTVSPAIDQAPVLDDAPDRWLATPVAQAFRTIADELQAVALDGDFVAAVTDADGTIVWSVGGRTMRRRAEDVAFAPGGRWDEAAVGTNALGMALRTDRPTTVWSAEHYASFVHDWVCYSAPVHDPLTRLPCGVIDLSTTWRKATPLALSTVTALARLLDHALAGIAPGGLIGGGGLRLSMLGRSEITLDGVTITMAPRQVELLAVLSLHPDGLNLEQLHDRLHGERAILPSTTKAEISHVRHVLGAQVLNRPYRLAGPVWADHVEVLDAVRRGDVDAAVARYRGPLLPMSEAPAIVDHRNLLEVALIDAVVRAGSPDTLAGLAERVPHVEFLQELVVARLPGGDHRRSIALGRLDALRR